MLDAEDLAVLQDEDFTYLGGENQIHWAPSQTEQWKIDANFLILCQHLESVAADKKHTRTEECQGVLTAITSLKFLKMLYV